MAGKGKRFKTAAGLYDQSKAYDYAEAIRIIKQTATAKFDETIEVAMRLGVDVKHADQQIRGTTILPHGIGKDVKILVFAAGEKLTEAEQAGANFAGGDDLIEKVKGGWFDFDVAIATPDMMSKVGKLGKLLGPRGLMPNPKSGTVTFNVAESVKEFKSGKIEYRTDRFGIVHGVIGKKSFTDEKLQENLAAFVQTIVKAKPSAAKGQYLRSISISSTMGPGVKISLSSI